MMFSMQKLVSLAAVVAVAAASPALDVRGYGKPSSSATDGMGTEPTSSCSTGPVQCCNSAQTVGSLQGSSSSILKSLPLWILEDPDVLVGLDCNNLIVGQSSCQSQALCCTNSNAGSPISVGCAPVTL
ncbi:hypothetical protein GYMLUDRAFT_48462 [Collybiopsis luxurians FD-317 M1]|uniref:Hydrophobin n=1 Tax=Collybiopsis luxurians FD-317 M1 TaxID=944289 RepID=A0A0D0C9T2_9AGAR|nr:hypothetical protein GYMLUDRAFT_48462 [Collybiopsis luxurians FD-317 M1]